MIFTTRALQIELQSAREPFNEIMNHELAEKSPEAYKRKQYFVRHIGIDENEEIYKQQLGKLVQRMKETGPFLYLAGTCYQVSYEESQRYMQLYEAWEKVRDASLKEQFDIAFPMKFQNKMLELTQKTAFAKVLGVYDQAVPNANASMKKNFAVKLLGWMGHYLPLLYGKEEMVLPKVIFAGSIKRQELLFLYYLSLVGCDVLYLNPKEDILGAYPECQQFSTLHEMSRKAAFEMPVQEEIIGGRAAMQDATVKRQVGRQSVVGQSMQGHTGIQLGRSAGAGQQPTQKHTGIQLGQSTSGTAQQSAVEQQAKGHTGIQLGRSGGAVQATGGQTVQGQTGIQLGRSAGTEQPPAGGQQNQGHTGIQLGRSAGAAQTSAGNQSEQGHTGIQLGRGVGAVQSPAGGQQNQGRTGIQLGRSAGAAQTITESQSTQGHTGESRINLNRGNSGNGNQPQGGRGSINLVRVKQEQALREEAKAQSSQAVGQHVSGIRGANRQTYTSAVPNLQSQQMQGLGQNQGGNTQGQSAQRQGANHGGYNTGGNGQVQSQTSQRPGQPHGGYNIGENGHMQNQSAQGQGIHLGTSSSPSGSSNRSEPLNLGRGAQRQPVQPQAIQPQGVHTQNVISHAQPSSSGVLQREHQGGSPSASRRELTYEELAQLSSSVVMIGVKDQQGQVLGSGSGVVIHPDGYILTNFHVVRGGSLFGVKFENETSIYDTYRIIKYHSDYDLAIIKVEKRCKALPIYEGSPVVRGQKVVAIGSPLGLFNSVSDGIISAFREFEFTRMIQFTAPISHGSSGGALLNMYGELIGISTGGFDDGQNLNVAIDYETIRRFAGNYI